MDFKKIYLIPTKTKSLRDKKYRVSYDMKRFKINTPTMSCPFGLETFNDKEIINLEIINDSNDKNNFMSDINVLDNLYKQFSENEHESDLKLQLHMPLRMPFVNLPTDFLKDVKDHKYMPIYRKSNNGMTIRTHVKNMEVYKNVNGKQVLLNKYEAIKGKKCKCSLEFDSIWIKNGTYGLLFYVTKMEILD